MSNKYKKLKKMNTKKVISMWGLLTFFCMGSVVAQSRFTERVNMNNVGNKNDTYYLLLCQSQSRTASKVSGTIATREILIPRVASSKFMLWSAQNHVQLEKKKLYICR